MLAVEFTVPSLCGDPCGGKKRVFVLDVSNDLVGVNILGVIERHAESLCVLKTL